MLTFTTMRISLKLLHMKIKGSMSTQLNKNWIKKLVSIAGVVSTAAFLSVPALALTSPISSDSDDTVNTHTEHTRSTVSSTEVLAQNNPGNEPSTPPANEPSTPSGGDRVTEPSSTPGSDRVNQSSPTPVREEVYERSTTERVNVVNQRLLTGGDSVRGVNWYCLNNPRCGSSN